MVNHPTGYQRKQVKQRFNCKVIVFFCINDFSNIISKAKPFADDPSLFSIVHGTRISTAFEYFFQK